MTNKNTLGNHVRGVTKHWKNTREFVIEGEMLGYLRHQASLPYPTTKLNGISKGNEGQQWLLRGDASCDLVAIKVTRNRKDCSYSKHSFSLYVLYKKGTWEHLMCRDAHVHGQHQHLLTHGVGVDGWKSIEDVLDEFADIITHLFDVYGVAVIK